MSCTGSCQEHDEGCGLLLSRQLFAFVVLLLYSRFLDSHWPIVYDLGQASRLELFKIGLRMHQGIANNLLLDDGVRNLGKRREPSLGHCVIDGRIPLALPLIPSCGKQDSKGKQDMRAKSKNRQKKRRYLSQRLHRGLARHKRPLCTSIIAHVDNDRRRLQYEVGLCPVRANALETVG